MKKIVVVSVLFNVVSVLFLIFFVRNAKQDRIESYRQGYDDGYNDRDIYGKEEEWEREF